MPFIALLRENRNPGKFKPVFGPTIRAVVTEQFHRIFYSEDGDWWEDRMDDVAGFEDEIYDTTIASVINDNTDAFVQDDAFLFSKGGFTIPKKGTTPPRPCDSAIQPQLHSPSAHACPPCRQTLSIR